MCSFFINLGQYLMIYVFPLSQYILLTIISSRVNDIMEIKGSIHIKLQPQWQFRHFDTLLALDPKITIFPIEIPKYWPDNIKKPSTYFYLPYRYHKCYRLKDEEVFAIIMFHFVWFSSFLGDVFFTLPWYGNAPQNPTSNQIF